MKTTKDKILQQVKKFIEEQDRQLFSAGQTYVRSSGVAWDSSDVVSLVETGLSMQYAEGKITYEFERHLATFTKQRYAIACNSGSSANLLAISSLMSKKLGSRALKKGDEEKLLQLAYYGQGDLAIDAHIAPVHPEYCEKPINQYDPEGAKALLAEAGYADGLKVTLATKNDLEEPEVAQALKEMAAPGGFDITLDITDPGGYWDRWTEVDFGLTSWTHRPLGTMVMRLGYTSDAEGKPVEWNETRWVDKEFEDLLVQAEATLDVEARRAIMCNIEDIFIERGPISIPFWKRVWNIVPKTFKNIQAHPTEYDQLTEVWKDQA